MSDFGQADRWTDEKSNQDVIFDQCQVEPICLIPDCASFANALVMIANGTAKRIDLTDKILMYKVGKLIRVDIAVD